MEHPGDRDLTPLVDLQHGHPATRAVRERKPVYLERFLGDLALERAGLSTVRRGCRAGGSRRSRAGYVSSALEADLGYGAW